MKAIGYRSLWSRWVIANSIAELIGLGATFAVGVGLFSGLAETPGILPTILTGLLMTSSGAIEGAIVGLAQWAAMRPAFPEVPRRPWLLATVIGALVAWFLGSITMTIASLGASGQEQTAPELALAVVLLMASAMGLAAGLVLALPQWRVLRRSRHQAWLWLPANGIAWAAGMPVIFAAIDLAQRGSPPLGIVVMAISLAVTGAIVGAIHGLALVKLANSDGRFE